MYSSKAKILFTFFLILIFLCGLLILVSFLLRLKIIFLGIPYMFTPFFATILTAAIFKISFKELGISLNLNRWFFVAWLLPVILVFLSLGINLLFPSVEFSIEREGLLRYGVTREALIKANEKLIARGISPLIYSLLLSVVVGPTFNALVAFGEEIGWRGLLLKEFSNLGFWQSSLITGIIWGIWHAPLILQGHNYPEHPYAGVVMMTIFTILFSPLFNLVRIKSGSVFAPSIMHGMLNAVAGISIAYVKGGNDLITGINGLSGFIVLAIANIFLYLILKKKLIQLENG